MESILNLIVNAENMRVVFLAVLGFCGFVLMNRRMDRMEYSLNKRIDGVESSLNKRIDDLRHTDLAAIHKRIDDLKTNDLAHIESSIGSLKGTIEALTFTLEKNGSLTKEDKGYIDTRLAL